MQAKAKAVQRGITQQHALPPPPPYSAEDGSVAQVATVESAMSPRASPHVHQPLQRKYSPVVSSESVSRSDSPQSTSSCDGRPSPGYPDNGAPPLPPTGKWEKGFQRYFLHDNLEFEGRNKLVLRAGL